LYLWHWPVIVLWKAYSGGGIGLLDGPAIAVVSVLLAWGSKVFVEDKVRTAPIVTAKTWRSLATVVTVLVPVGLVATYTPPPAYHAHVDAAHPGAEVLAGNDVRVPPAAPRPTPEQAPQDFAGGGDCQTPIVGTKPRPCVFGATKNYRLTVALIGDSVADQWRTPLIALAKQQRWRLVTDLHGQCAWTATILARYGTTNEPYVKCHDWGQQVLHDMLTKYHPDVVVTSARPVLATLAHPKADPVAFGQIADGMVQYWRQLAAHGTRIVAIKESPEPRRDVPACLTRPGSSPQACSTPVARAIVQQSAMTQAVAKAKGIASIVDVNSLICGPHTCAPIVGNVTVYRDTHHLTLTYINTLRPYVDRQLLATKVFKRRWH
jgi:hypothetical protein